MPSTTLTIDQIEISPFNVRTCRPDAEDTGALEASILADGLLNPIVVHPMKGRKGKWGAVAGGRRTRAIRALVGRGDLAADWPVKVDVREGAGDAELIEVSISENLIRKDLRDHELYAAVARAKDKGHDVETIARALGQVDSQREPDVAKVRRWARLGELAPPVFAALVAGRIAVEQASAYAATADVALQAAVFEQLGAAPAYTHTPTAIRRAMKVGDHDAARLLTFVGEGIYRAAGGGYELDLFADVEPDRGRVTDETLLQRLVQEKMATIRDQVRVTCQDKDLRFVMKPPQTEYGGNDHQLQVTPKSASPGSRTLLLPSADVVAHIEVDHAGDAVVSYWWESRKAKFGSEKAEKPGRTLASIYSGRIGNAIETCGDMGHARAAADAAIKEETGLSQDTTQVFRAQRKAIVRGILVDNARAGGDVAVDYLVWAQLRMLAGAGDTLNRASRLGIRQISSDGYVGLGGALEKMQAHVAPMPATATIAAAIAELQRQTFFTDPDLAEAFRDYRASSAYLKRLAAAVVVGIALERSLAADGYRVPVHDVLAEQARMADDESIRLHWTPTESLLGQLPKTHALAIAKPFVDAPTLASWGKLKVAELVRKVLAVVTGVSPSTIIDRRDAAERWVHPLLRFEPPHDGDAADTETRELEAAE